MKKKDFDNWVNHKSTDLEADKLEQLMMENLSEFRLKEQLKQRLQAHRARRTYLNRGFIGLFLLAIIGLAFYKVFYINQKISSQDSRNTSAFDKQVEGSFSINKTSSGSTQNRTIKDSNIQIPKPNAPQFNAEKGVPLPDLRPSSTPINAPDHKPLPTIADVKKSPTDTTWIYQTSDTKPMLLPRFSIESQENVPNITVWDLNKKKLLEVPPSVLTYKKLEILSLNRNQIRVIPDGIGDLTALITLDLSSNKLTTLPTTFGNLQQLEKLNLRKNKFKIFPIILTELTDLLFLDLMGNYIKTLPSEIKKMNGLRALNLEFNSFSTLPEEFGELQQLTDLNLRGNYFDTIPAPICRLPQLIFLNLSSNKLRSLPTEIEALTALKALDLRNNRLDFLPDEISNLSALTTLNLSGNLLSELPETIKNLKNLKTLNLRENPISLDEIGKIQLLLPNCNVLR